MDFDLGTPRAVIAFAKRVAESATSLKSPSLTTEQAEEVLSRLESRDWQDERQKSRDLRKLPWMLSVGTPPLYRRDCFHALLFYLSEHLSGLKLKGLVFSCLMLDPKQDSERVEALCSLALRSISNEKRQVESRGRRLNPFLQHWNEWADVLKTDSVSQVGGRLLDGSLRDWRERLRIPTNSPRMPELLRSVAKACCQKADHKIPELLDSLRESQSLEQKAALLNEILKTKLSLNKIEPDQALISFGLQHFGDPRTDTKARWSSISQSGRDLVARWLSEEDLRIFFTHLGGDEKSERRKNYWSKFVEAGRINYSRIFFNPGDWQRLPADVKRDPHIKHRHGHFESYADSCSSAFILGIEDYYVVEFSLTGNASRLFRKQDLPWDVVMTARYPNQNFLKKENYAARLNHRAHDWESDFDFTLGGYFSFKIPSSRGRRYR